MRADDIRRPGAQLPQHLTVGCGGLFGAELVPAKSAIRVGAENQGDPGLFITIGPPYGQEIAVAFAASEPLFDGTRPLIEPAAPYLQFLKQRVAAARERSADFKGEWVYFFITTAAQ